MTTEPTTPVKRDLRDTGDLVNWTLIDDLASKPHKHLNIADDFEAQLRDTPSSWLGEVFEESRTVHHLLDLAGIPEGWGYSAHVDARAYLLVAEVLKLRERLDRISGWHSRETFDGGMVGDFCTDCGQKWPCDTRRMADGTYEDQQG